MAGEAAQLATFDDGRHAAPSTHGNTADRNWVLQASAMWRSRTHSKSKHNVNVLAYDFSSSRIFWARDVRKRSRLATVVSIWDPASFLGSQNLNMKLILDELKRKFFRFSAPGPGCSKAD